MKDPNSGTRPGRGFARPGARRVAAAIVLLLLTAWSSPGAAQTVDEAIGLREKTNGATAKAQLLIDQLSDDADGLAAKYRSTLQETRALDVYNEQLEELVSSQESEMASLRQQIDGVTAVGREVMPLMLRMIDALEKFIALDVPFLPEERRARALDLRQMMDRADVTISEKYRRILEAYQIENEFGRSIEAYRGTLDVDGSSRSVDFLRIGRNALLYQTLDARQSGVWDPNTKSWTPLGDEYRLSIQQGLRMAKKQTAPDLIRVPIPAARSAQ
jgi:hypothetical protein